MQLPQEKVMHFLAHEGTIEKTVLLFLAEIADSDDIPQIHIRESEVKEVRWVPFNQVEGVLTFDKLKIGWREAISRPYLQNKLARSTI